MSTIPATLYIGDENALFTATLTILQKEFCHNKPNTTPECYCSACRKLKNHQHESVIWIEPEKKYVLEDIAIIFQKISFQLASDEICFFILANAQHLTPVTSNKLLKTLEEPPAGYRFILTTNNEQALLPTIRSRCNVLPLNRATRSHATHPLLPFLLDPSKRNNVFEFEQVFRKEKPNEEETISVLHTLIEQLETNLIASYKNNTPDKTLEAQRQYVLQLLTMPPQPGSAAFFWKQLFLGFPGE